MPSEAVFGDGIFSDWYRMPGLAGLILPKLLANNLEGAATYGK
ncbi:hypothetical protein [Neisseria bergeri]|nr:hypothetical protein [Neisseria bergeri]